MSEHEGEGTGQEPDTSQQEGAEPGTAGGEGETQEETTTETTETTEETTPEEGAPADVETGQDAGVDPLNEQGGPTGISAEVDPETGDQHPPSDPPPSTATPAVEDQGERSVAQEGDQGPKAEGYYSEE